MQNTPEIAPLLMGLLNGKDAPKGEPLVGRVEAPVSFCCQKLSADGWFELLLLALVVRSHGCHA